MPQENGVVIGIVADLDDPEALGRVRVKFPHLNDELSDWSRLAAPLGGKETGWFLRPNVNDEVLVLWEQGDARRSYVVGSLWSKVDPPPPDDGKKVDNNWRFFRSRSGHVLKFDDTSGQERIEIVGTGEQHKLVIDVSGSKIEISCSSGDIAISAPAGKLSLDANQVEIKATSTMSVEAGATLTLKGATVAIN
jgi:uncharacterized protein involved in type VI secretion and phage assembly